MKLLNSLIRQTARLKRAGARLTIAGGTVSHSFNRTALLLKRQIWIWPVIAILILSATGYLVRSSIERTMKNNLASQLQTLLGVEVSMLENWIRDQSASTETIANDPRVRTQVYLILTARDEVLAEEKNADSKPKSTSQMIREIRQALAPTDDDLTATMSISSLRIAVEQSLPRRTKS